MTLLASTWLALSLVLCMFAWFAGRWLALALPFAAVITAFALMVITGTPRFMPPPPGKYTVLGARIDVDVAIYALLDDGNGAPTFYKLPYSTSAANSLQSALDGAENGQGVQANVDGEGGASFEGPPPVTGEPPKVPEAPAVSIP